MISNVVALSAKTVQSKSVAKVMIESPISSYWESHFNNWTTYYNDYINGTSNGKYTTSSFSRVGESTIKVKREGSRISAWTSEFGSDDLPDDYAIVVDVDNLSDMAGNGIPYFKTSTFPNGGKIGFSTLS